MLRRSVSLFNLTSVLVVLGIIVADALLFRNWTHFTRVLGGALGAEIGLLIFLHVLAGLFVIEGLEPRLHGSRWFRWYFRLPAAGDTENVLDLSGFDPERLDPKRVVRTRAWIAQRVPMPVVKLGVFTTLFYSLETFLLPFLPVLLNIQAEILVIALILAWHTLPFRVDQRSEVAPAPADFELG